MGSRGVQSTAKTGRFDKASMDHQDVLKPQIAGSFFPLLLSPVYLTLTTTLLFTLHNSLSILPDAFYKLSMGYSDNSDNPNLHSTSSSPCELDAYPFLSQASIIEEVNGSLSTFTGGCSVGKKPDHITGLQRTLRAEASLGKHSRSLLDDRCLTCEPHPQKQ